MSLTRNALILVVIASALSSAACKTREASAAPTAAQEAPLAVTTADAREATVPRFVPLTGSLEANRSSDVAADANGKVIATYVERGSRVKKGQILARLDTASAAISAAQAKADAEGARADADLKKTELARSKRLHAQGAIADAELDRAESQMTSSSQKAASNDARFALQAKAVGDGIIRAPFDGVIAERFIDAGEYVRADSKVVTLVELDTLRLELTVPEAAALAIKEGQDVGFHVAASNEPYVGKVRFVGPQLRKTSRDLIVEAIVDNTNGQLRAGMFATARVAIGEEKAIVVPAGAIRGEETSKRAFVLANGKLEERVVQVGDSHQGDVVVLGGIRVGDRVVTSAGDLRDGRKAQ